MRISSRRQTWMLFVAITVSIVALALSPPLLSPFWRTAVMHAFAPVCHQITVRSPHLGSVQIAICDRCLGIYLGLVVGVATIGWGHSIWRSLGTYGRFLLLGSLLPMGIDWIGPILGFWHNVPVSRAATGGVFGIVAASFATDRMLQQVARRADSGRGAKSQ